MLFIKNRGRPRIAEPQRLGPGDDDLLAKYVKVSDIRLSCRDLASTPLNGQRKPNVALLQDGTVEKLPRLPSVSPTLERELGMSMVIVAGAMGLSLMGIRLWVVFAQ